MAINLNSENAERVGKKFSNEFKKKGEVMPQGKPIAKKDIINPNRLRIVGGTARGRKIDSPDVYLRPMMAKVRHSIMHSIFKTAQ